MKFPEEFVKKAMAVYPKNLSLQWALERGDVKSVRQLLESGRDIKMDKMVKAAKRFSKACDLVAELSELERKHEKKHMLTP